MARWFWSVIWDGVDPKVDITDPITVKYIRTLVIVIAYTYRLLPVNAPRQTDARAEGPVVTRETLGGIQRRKHCPSTTPLSKFKKAYLPVRRMKRKEHLTWRIRINPGN